MAFPLAAMAGLQIGSSLLGGLFGDKGAKERARAYGDAMNYVGTGYNEAFDYLDPRYQQEQNAMGVVNNLLGLTGDGSAPDYSVFRDAPGYQFSLDEGQRAIERSAAARGGLASGNTLIALQDRAQNVADMGFENYLAHVLGLSNQGVDTMFGNMAINRGTTLGNLRLGQGDARASGIESIGNSLIGGVKGFAGIYGQNYGQNMLAPKTAPATPIGYIPRTQPTVPGIPLPRLSFSDYGYGVG